MGFYGSRDMNLYHVPWLGEAIPAYASVQANLRVRRNAAYGRKYVHHSIAVRIAQAQAALCTAGRHSSPVIFPAGAICGV